jgi:alpha-N-arabinofuranosidase
MGRRTNAAIVTAAAATLVAALAGPAAAESTTNTVTVHADQPIATLAGNAIGANTPIWNPNLTHPVVASRIRTAGLRTLAFNGGGVSDLYHWADGSLSHDPDAAHHPYDYYSLKPQFSFDQFESVAKRAGAGTFVHVNYGTGTAAEAAGWVRYANKIKNYRVRDWEVGEEVYLNGYLPDLNIEPDAHADKSPEAYARNVVEYSRAMKAVDPTIRVGVGLLVSGPGPSVYRDWNETVLRIAGPAIDFVDLHWYPSTFVGSDQATLLGSADAIPTIMQDVRATVDQLAGPRVAITIGETNSAITGGPDQIAPFNALFLAEHALTMLENEADSVDVWALHNGDDGSGDLGLLASGDCAGCAPDDTPYPPYFGVQLATQVAGHGGRLLQASSPDELVRVHASRRADGSLAVMLINTDPTTARTVRLAGCTGRSTAEVWSYQPGDQQVRVKHEHATPTRTLPPYSITVLILPPGR